MSTGILSCEALQEYVAAAQAAVGTNHPVFLLERKYHDEPADMKRHIAETIAALPPEVDTILVAMGFCGGSWDHVMFDRRIVIPRVDDCISLLLHTDDDYCPNRKEMGHLYLTDRDPGQFSPARILQSLYEKLPPGEAESQFELWFTGYSHLDIIDTGLYDCYDEEFVAEAQRQADLIHCELDFVPGGNRIIEKLLRGNWDHQFLVAEPGHCIKHGDFF